MNVFLATLALTSHRQLMSQTQHKDHPLRQLLSHRQLMSQAQCDAAYSSIAAAATSDSACKQAAGMVPTMAAQILPSDMSVSESTLSVFSTVNTCDELKSAWDTLCFGGGGGGGGGGGTEPDVPDDTDVGVGQDDGDDEDPCESECPEGKCEGVCESEADINKPECADYVACNSDLGNATEEDDTEEDDVRALHHHRQRPAPEPPPPPRRPPPPDSVYRLSFPRTTIPFPARACAAR